MTTFSHIYVCILKEHISNGFDPYSPAVLDRFHYRLMLGRTSTGSKDKKDGSRI